MDRRPGLAPCTNSPRCCPTGPRPATRSPPPAVPARSRAGPHTVTWLHSTRAWWSSRIDSATRMPRPARRPAGQGPVDHFPAVRLWGVLDQPRRGDPCDRSGRSLPRNTAGVTVHRTILPLPVTRIDDIPVTPLGRSLVDAWDWVRPHLSLRTPRPTVHRTPRCFIELIRGRRLSNSGAPRRVRGVPGACRAAGPESCSISSTVAARASGRSAMRPPRCCPVARLPRWVQQYGTAWPTAAAFGSTRPRLEAQVAVELDGAAFHGSREARERDLRRDTALAALGGNPRRGSATPG